MTRGFDGIERAWMDSDELVHIAVFMGDVLIEGPYIWYKESMTKCGLSVPVDEYIFPFEDLPPDCHQCLSEVRTMDKLFYDIDQYLKNTSADTPKKEARTISSHMFRHRQYPHVLVDAVHYQSSQDYPAVMEWIKDNDGRSYCEDGQRILVGIDEGWLSANPGDYIFVMTYYGREPIKGSAFWVETGEKFNETYEKIVDHEGSIHRD